MKIPNKVKIAGYSYTVERPKESFPNGVTVCDGVHLFTEQIIKVAKSGSEEYQNTVFLHELVHGIIGSYCGEISEQLNESFTEQFSKGLYQVIVDNPEIFHQNDNLSRWHNDNRSLQQNKGQYHL